MKIFSIYKSIYNLVPSKSKYILILMSFLLISGLDLISLTTLVVLLSKILNTNLDGEIFSYLKEFNDTKLILALIIMIISKQLIYIIILATFLNYSYSIKNLFILRFVNINFLLKSLYDKKENQLNFIRIIEQFSNNSLIPSFMLAFEIIVIVTVFGYLLFWDFKSAFIIILIFFILGSIYYSIIPKFIRKLGEKNIYLNTIILKIIGYVNDGLREIISFEKLDNILIPLQQTLSKLKTQLITYDILNAIPRLSFEIIIIIALSLLFLLNNNVANDFLLNSSIFVYAFVKLVPSILKFINIINSLNYGDYALNEIKKINKIYLNEYNKKIDINNINKNNISDNFDYIEVDNLSITFENNKIINYPNFRINKNEKILILSKSGKGKSTLLDIFCDFKKSETGKIQYIYKNKKIMFDNKEIAYSPQLNLIIDGSFSQNIEIKIDETSTQHISNLVLNFLSDNNNILSDKSLLQASGGEKKRIGILRTIINSQRNKSILVFDEPTASLDENNKEIFYSWLDSVNNKTIIVASHDENREKHYDKVLRL